MPFPFSLEEKAPWKSSVGVLTIAFSLSLSRKGLFQSSPRKPGGLGGSTRDCLLTLPVEEKAISRGQNSGLRGLFSLPAEEKALQSVGSFQEPARRIKNPFSVDEKGFPDRLREAQRAGRGLDGSARDCMFTLPVEKKAIPRGQIHTRFEIGVLAKCRFPVPVDLSLLFCLIVFFIIEILEIAEVPEVFRESRLDRLDRWPAQVEYVHKCVLAFSPCLSKKT